MHPDQPEPYDAPATPRVYPDGAALGPAMAPPHWDAEEERIAAHRAKQSALESDARIIDPHLAALCAVWGARGAAPVPMSCDVCGRPEVRTPDGRRWILVHDEAVHAARAQQTSDALDRPVRRAGNEDDELPPAFSTSRSSGVPLTLRRASALWDDPAA